MEHWAPRTETIEQVPPRAERTVTTLLLGRLVRPGHVDTPCRIRNMSATGMLIEVRTALRENDRITVEVRGACPLNGRIAWTNDGRAGVQFDDMIDVEGLLHSISSGGGVNDAGSARAPRFDADSEAMVGVLGRLFPATLENISQGGARVVCDQQLEPGRHVSLAVPQLGKRPCVVRWTDGESIGLSFLDKLTFGDLSAWLDGHGKRRR
ncbi:PilZ domain-containing protein [Sphingomonas sp.]|uniref:PilZ domain-containing protein n=1 Tax=Sphingomonas sp. TaxID=28214 RepID=UPI001B0BC533|nr:PilZ domain-containing protein [Sphingomonas sp.]MBO9713477.1 PilZ domain-containing protein [Sphingomonas sp.]